MSETRVARIYWLVARLLYEPNTRVIHGNPDNPYLSRLARWCLNSFIKNGHITRGWITHRFFFFISTDRPNWNPTDRGEWSWEHRTAIGSESYKDGSVCTPRESRRARPLQRAHRGKTTCPGRSSKWCAAGTRPNIYLFCRRRRRSFHFSGLDIGVQVLRRRDNDAGTWNFNAPTREKYIRRHVRVTARNIVATCRVSWKFFVPVTFFFFLVLSLPPSPGPPLVSFTSDGPRRTRPPPSTECGLTPGRRDSSHFRPYDERARTPHGLGTCTAAVRKQNASPASVGREK